ncbi:phage tail tape measure protein [Brenneria uluponensis]|uniref:phage tail tape measure protein n=1 Tax=Brenneria uluponensis TaxID=3057057 RepID=UPI0028E804A4|nr:phage tail tape measure protein [Brenneria ulupoensis]
MTDRNLSIKVAFNAINNLTRPVNAARQSAAALASQIKTTQSTIKDLEKQASSFDRLTTASNKTTRQLAEAKAKAAAMRTEFGPLRGRTEEQTAALNKQRAVISQLGRAQKDEQQRLSQLRVSFAQQGIVIDRSRKATEQISQHTARYNRQLAEQQRRLSAISLAQSRYNKAKEMQGKLMSGGMKAAVTGSGMLYAAQRTMNPGIDFDKNMARVQALTRMDKTDPRLAQLRDQARTLGATTAFTAGDAATGQAFLAMAGFTPQAIKAALPGVLNMAMAGGMELGESSDIGSNVLSQFQLSADQMGRVSDVLTGTFTRTNTDLRQLGETMVYAGPVAAKLGVSLESMAAMSGALADKGIRGSMAGTALRASLSRLASPTAAAKKALDELGVSVADANGKMRPTEQILTDLYNQSKKYGQVDQVSFWKDIAGEEAFIGLQTLVESAGSGKLQILTRQLQNARGEAEKNARIMANNLDGDIKSMKSAWESLGIQMEESIDSPLRRLTQKFTSLLKVIGEWMKAHPKLTSALVTGSLVIAGLTAALGAMAILVAGILGPLALMRLSITMLTGGRGFGLLSFLTSRFSFSLSGLLPSLSRVPASLLSWRAAATTASGALGGLWQRIAGMGRGIFISLLGGAGRVGNVLTMAFTRPGAALSALGNGLRSLAVSGFSALSGAGMSAFNILRTGIMLLFSPIGLIGAALVGVGLLIYKYWEPLKAFFSGYFSGIMSQLEPLKAAFAPLSTMFDSIGVAIGRVWDWFTKLLQPVQSSTQDLEACKNAGEAFGNVVGTVLKGLISVILKVAKGIGLILEKLGVIPEAASAAQAAANQMNSAIPEQGTTQKKTVMYVWDEKQKKMVAQEWEPKLPKKSDAIVKTGDTASNNTPLADSQPVYGTERRKSSADSSTATTQPTAEKDPNKLGDIVFKNVPPALRLNGGYNETRIAQAQKKAPLLDRIKQTAGELASSVMPFAVQPALAGVPVGNPTAAQIKASMSSGIASTDSYTINISIHDARNLDENKLAVRIRHELQAAERDKQRRRGSQFTDHA